MARRAMITPLTLYNRNQHLFDGLQLPDYHFPRSNEYDDLFLTEGWTLDKQTLIDNLLLETAEMDTIYTDPEFLQYAIGAWCRKEYHIWASLYETCFYKYNPIWNKDGSIKENTSEVRNLMSGGTKTRTRSGAGTVNDSEHIGDTDNVVDSRAKTEARNNVTTDDVETIDDSTTVNSVSAFDAMDVFHNRDKADTDTSSIRSEHGTDTGSTSTGEDGTSDRTYERNRSNASSHTDQETEHLQDDTTDSGSITHDNERHEYGNIGVTTTQQMIEAERALVRFNIYDVIIESFKDRFCILLY